MRIAVAGDQRGAEARVDRTALGGLAMTPDRRLPRRSVLLGPPVASFLAGACQHAPSNEETGPGWSPRLSENIGSLDDATLRWMAQLGLQWVVLQGTDSIDRDGKGHWSEQDVAAVRERCASYGLKLHSLMLPISWLMNSMLGRPDRDRDIERIRTSIAAAGAVGVTVVEWRWSPDFRWGNEVGYYDKPGRGGATYKAFDFNRVREAPPFEEVGSISREQLWERMIYFTNGVMDAAEEAGIKMSLHPKDPPVKAMRGVSRILTSTEEIEAFLDAVPSPSNGFTFCQGTVTEMGVDVIDAIRRIGGRGRIHHVHFRAVRGSVPRYEETFIDEGDVDMLEAMRAYKEVGYDLAIVSDHSPGIPGDLSGRKIGRSFSHGYIRGLVQAVNA